MDSTWENHLCIFLPSSRQQLDFCGLCWLRGQTYGLRLFAEDPELGLDLFDQLEFPSLCGDKQ